MLNLTKVYLTKKFEEYYRKAKLTLPREFEKREFAFVPFEFLPDFVMFRHISFRSLDEFNSYITSKVPAHIYYSSAYYKWPDAEKMEKKYWLGADLIFDIDADHLLARGSSEKLLNMAKKEAKKLIIILKKDFGVDDDYIKIYFSGSRGYHIHVYKEEFIRLDSAERREKIDYLALTSPKIFEGKFIKNTNAAIRIISYIRRKLRNSPQLLEKYGLTNEDFESLSANTLNKRVKKVVEKLLPQVIEKLKVYIDAPVTADVKRLIRMPGSLHGKTGLKVSEVKDLEEFDPFRDAVVFDDDEVEIKTLKKVKLRIGEVNLRIPAGEVVKVPEYAAIFLLCRGEAIYG